MHSIEFAARSYTQGKRYALGLIITWSDSFETEFKCALQTAILWREDRRILAGAIAITIVIPNDTTVDVEPIVSDRLSNEDAISALASLPVTVWFITPEQTMINTFDLRGGMQTEKFRWTLIGRYDHPQK